MDTIRTVIHSMEKSQQKEFVYFIQRNRYRRGRKDLQLFNLLKEDKERKPEELVKLLQTQNLNAYHTLRKRLFNHLADFFVLKSTSEDASPVSHVNGLLSVVNYLFEKGLNEQGWKYLRIAESIAQHNEYYDLLNTIFLLQIDHAHLQSALLLQAIIAAYQSNQVLLRQEEKIQIAQGVVKNELIHAREKGMEIDFQQLMGTALNDVDLHSEVMKTPKIVLTLLRIVRTGMIVRKDFYRFEPYLLGHYERLYPDQQKVFNPMVKSEFLYMIAHTCYRTTKFGQSQEYLSTLKNVLLLCSTSYQRQMEVRIVQLESANLVFLNRLEEAIARLTQLLEKQKKRSINLYTNTIVNLGIFYFFKNDFKQSLQLLNQLSHSENWYKKTMGIEWVLKKNLMEILLFTELEYMDLVESRIRSIEKKYSHLKTNPIYENAFHYLSLIKAYLFKQQSNPIWLSQHIEQRFIFDRDAQEDIQAMAFYAWIKAKALQQGFYATLLSLFD